MTDWLLDSDPALRWQVLRDLLQVPPDEVAAERSRVAVKGWGARLLALRGADGQWAGGAFPGRLQRRPHRRPTMDLDPADVDAPA